MAGKLRMSNKKFMMIWIPIIVVLTSIILVATIFMNSMAPWLNTYAPGGKGKRNVIPLAGTEDWDTQYYEAPYGSVLDNTIEGSPVNGDSVRKARENAQKVALEIAKEGIVLLKNKDNTLPIVKESNITPFGRAYVDPIYGGSGSGNINTINNVSAVAALNEVYNVNPAVQNKLEQELAAGITPRGYVNTDKWYDSDYYIGEFEEAIYNNLSFENYRDAGIVFIGRTGGEGIDLPRDMLGAIRDHANPSNPYIAGGKGKFKANTETARYVEGQHYLELIAQEKAAVEKAAQECDKVIVIINSSNAMELGWLEENNSVDAVLWIGGPGSMGMKALASILIGETNPSGKMVDTYYADFTKDPVWENYGRNSYINITKEDIVERTGGFAKFRADMKAGFVEYEEGVYLGYKYYETMYELLGAQGDAWYNAWRHTADKASDTGVVYPFGYGLSYSSFNQEIVSYKTNAKSINMTIKVTNTGNRAGKEVVQLYFASEYTDSDKQYLIEKPTKNLVYFDKTDIIEPGKSREIEVSFLKEDMASYCFMRENPDGTKGCYTLGEGEYTIYVAKNSHDSYDITTWNNNSRIWYDNNNPRKTEIDAQSALDDAGNPLGFPEKSLMNSSDDKFVAATNQFEESNDYMTTGSRNLLTRANGSSGFTSWKATKPVGQELVASEEVKKNLITIIDYSTDEWINSEDTTPRQGESNGLSVIDMRGKSFFDPEWRNLLAQVSVEEMEKMVLNGMYAKNEINSITMPHRKESEGTMGLAGAFGGGGRPDSCAWTSPVVLASTWNTDLARDMGSALGLEATTLGTSGIYAPAMNIHRSPFSGRNFEYYSEDGFISGLIGAGVVSGATSQGLATYVKHFVLNDQETDRCNGDLEGATATQAGICTWATEQTMREIYMKTFELMVKEAKCEIKYIADKAGNVKTKIVRAATGIMSSFNRIGSVWAGGHKGLITNVLRSEWNFNGTVITDMAMYFQCNPSANLHAGADVMLGVSMFFPKDAQDIHSDTATVQNLLVNATHHVAYTAALTNAMNGIAPGTIISYSMAPWQTWLIISNIVIYTFVVTMIIVMVVRKLNEKKYPQKYKRK